MLFKWTGLFLLFKVYSESGFGLNIYYQGFRAVGFDVHSWKLAQDPISKKPLPPEKQYWCWPRPHLDIPPWNLHHWPFEDFEDAATLQAKMSATSERKEEKLARRAVKKARRDEKIRLRSPGPQLDAPSKERSTSADPDDSGGDLGILLNS